MVKRSTDQEQPDGSTEEKKELIWSYGTGVAVSTIADYGYVVLAEYTRPFNEGNIIYFRGAYAPERTTGQSFNPKRAEEAI